MDNEILELAREKLYAAVISDSLDSHGLHNQALPATIRPLDDRLVLCGRARTGLYMAIYHDNPETNVYENEIALVDDLGPNDVPVFVCGANLRICAWGELLSTAARVRGAAGYVTDGSVRDIRMIREMKFPVFCGGVCPLDTKHRGKMIMYDVPASIGGVAIDREDVVFGDADGVVVVPKGVAEDVLTKALEKVEGENLVRKELADGEKLQAVFDKYGIL